MMDAAMYVVAVADGLSSEDERVGFGDATSFDSCQFV